MRKYPINSTIDETYNATYIGANHLANGMTIGSNASSYAKFFDDEDIVSIENGLTNQKYCSLGNIKEAYILLKDEIKAKNPRSLLNYTICVYNAVSRFFGDSSKARMRDNFYPSEIEILNGKSRGQISDLYKKNMALSVERAMLAQNLLIELGISSIYKANGAIVDDKECVHAYNLISHDGKHYIFDATIPSVDNGRMSPIICEIPEEVFNTLSKPNSNIGISVDVTHLNPLNNADCNIIYDAGRNDVYKPSKSYTKKV